MLSIVLVVILAWTIFNVDVNAKPIIVEISEGNNQVIDVHQRSMQMVEIAVPLISAVTTFWLGVAVEGKRADQAQQNANQAKQDADQANQNTNEANLNANRAQAESEVANLKLAEINKLTKTRSNRKLDESTRDALSIIEGLSK